VSGRVAGGRAGRVGGLVRTRLDLWRNGEAMGEIRVHGWTAYRPPTRKAPNALPLLVLGLRPGIYEL
jgi:hypothetical protein